MHCKWPYNRLRTVTGCRGSAGDRQAYTRPNSRTGMRCSSNSKGVLKMSMLQWGRLKLLTVCFLTMLLSQRNEPQSWHGRRHCRNCHNYVQHTVLGRKLQWCSIPRLLFRRIGCFECLTPTTDVRPCYIMQDFYNHLRNVS